MYEPKIKHFGDYPNVYSVLVSLKEGRHFHSVAIWHFSKHSSLVNFIFNFKRARKEISAKCDSSTVTGADYPEHTLRWYACHNVLIEVFKMDVDPPHPHSSHYYQSPILQKIEENIENR